MNQKPPEDWQDMVVIAGTLITLFVFIYLIIEGVVT